MDFKFEKNKVKFLCLICREMKKGGIFIDGYGTKYTQADPMMVKKGEKKKGPTCG